MLIRLWIIEIERERLKTVCPKRITGEVDNRFPIAGTKGADAVVVGAFQRHVGWIALLRIVRRLHAQAGDHRSADGGRHHEPRGDVHAVPTAVEVEILRRLVVDGVGHPFRTWAVRRGCDDRITRLGDIGQLGLDGAAEGNKQQSDQTAQ